MNIFQGIFKARDKPTDALGGEPSRPVIHFLRTDMHAESAAVHSLAEGLVDMQFDMDVFRHDSLRVEP